MADIVGSPNLADAKNPCNLEVDILFSIKAIEKYGALLIFSLLFCKNLVFPSTAIAIERSLVKVVAHRATCSTAPENSLAAIGDCIAMGVDYVELDIRKTKDNKLILMHDSTIDRTTNGRGRVSDYSYAELLEFRLFDQKHALTEQTIPLFDDVLEFCKNRIMINVDDKEFKIKAIFDLVKRHGLLDQVLFKSDRRANAIVAALFPNEREIRFMPVLESHRVVGSNLAEIMDAYVKSLKTVAVELVFRDLASPLIHSDMIKLYQDHNLQLWVNTLNMNLSAGLDDNMAVNRKRPDAVWGFFLAMGFTMIQTDYPQELINFSNSHNQSHP